MLVQIGVHADRARVQPGLVREGARADVGGARIDGHVHDLADRMADAGGLAEGLGGHELHAHLQLQIREQGDEVGVAGALPVAVHTALDVGDPGADGGDRVGDRAAGVVVGVGAQPRRARPCRLEPDAQVLDDLGDLVREHPAVGVAQHEHGGAGLVRGEEHGGGVVGVVEESVEEVLRVDEHLPAEADEVGDGLAHHREVLLGGGAQRAGDMAQVRLRDQGDRRRAGIDERPDLRVLGDVDAGLAGRAEGGQACGAELQLGAGAGEELRVARDGAGPAALDVGHAQLVQEAGDGELVGHREGEPLLLGAVAQRRVVEVEGVDHGGGRGIRHDGLTPVGSTSRGGPGSGRTGCR